MKEVEEKNNFVRNLFLILFGMSLFFLVLIKGLEHYYLGEDSKIDKVQLDNQAKKIVNYKNIKAEVEIIGNELEKITDSIKKTNSAKVLAIQEVLKSDILFCKGLERDKVETKRIFDCYVKTKEKMKQFKPLIKDENISKLLSNEVVISESNTELSKEKNIMTKKEVTENSKDEAYQTIINIYKSLFNDYTKQLECCKKLEIEYEKDRAKKQLYTRVILQQNRILLECYETLELTEEGLESTTIDLNEKYSKKINKEIGDMAKIFSQNKKMIDEKLVHFRTKTN